MDKDSSRWLWFLWGRVACYALLGGLATAVMGAICVAIAGALTGWILAWPHFVFYDWAHFNLFEGPILYGAIFGAVLGGGGGGIAGLLSFSLIGFFSPPRRRFLPPRAVLLRILLGQVLGTLGVCASILALEAVYSVAIHLPFDQCVEQHLFFILFGVPTVMICGEIVGAISAFRREKRRAG